MISRNEARFSIEHANLLIAEARMTRVAVEDDLATPLKRLAEADEQLASVPGLRRARLRLLLERTKILRLLAEAALKANSGAEPNDAIRRLLDASAYDANLLRRIARHYVSGYWVQVAEAQEEEIRKVCVFAGHVPRHIPTMGR
jgi:hypothetical protein